MVALAFSAPVSFSISSPNRTASLPLYSSRNPTKFMVSALSTPYGDFSATGLFSKTSGSPLKCDEKVSLVTSTSRNVMVALPPRASLHESMSFLSSNDDLFLISESTGYSLASYYTSLGLFVISVPGLWSLIKRSVKSKIVKKTFVETGEAQKSPNQMAGEILSFFTRNNFTVTDRGDAITFEGMMIPSRGQAALLTFCTCISLASIALVLTITFPDVGNNWFWLTILSPLAGAYYWKRASRKEQIKVKMTVGDERTVSEIVVQGDDQQVEQLRKELQLSEKGMVYVKGIFER